MAELDYKLLEDPKMAREALQTLIKTKEGLDDFVDTLELLSNPRFKKNFGKGLREACVGKTVRLSVKELRKKHKLDTRCSLGSS